MKTLIALATINNWPIHQLDINNAFLHGFLDEKVYILPPAGYTKADGKVCELKRSLYGFKQVSRQWNTAFLINHGFTQSKRDCSLFTMVLFFFAILVYVDDVLITGKDTTAILHLKQALDKAFTIKDLGHMRYFVGIEVARSSAGTPLNQRKYILNILKDTSLTVLSACQFSSANYSQAVY